MKTTLQWHWFRRFTALVVAAACFPVLRATEPAPNDAPRETKEDDRDQPEARPARLGDRLRRPGEHVKNHREVRAAFASVVSQSRKSTTIVYSNGKKVALGTVVAADGYILTKASELVDQLEVQLVTGERHNATIVGIHRATDLAMLKIEAKDLVAVEWQTGDAPIVGSFLATPGFSNLPEAIGVVSVAAREIVAPGGVLGILLEQDEKGPRIDQVLPNSGAEKAGLRVNDIVLSVNGQVTKSRDELVNLVRGFNEGDQVLLAIVRGQESKNITATLGSREDLTDEERRGNFQNMLGGPLSKRRAGFPSAIQHDTVLRPADCGGPLVNLDGKAIGINIARSGRVESLALPVSVVSPLIEEMKSGKHAPPLATTSNPDGSVANKESENDNATTTGKTAPDNK